MSRQLFCGACDRPFVNREAMLAHIKGSSAPHPSCDLCGVRFASERALEAHTAAKHLHRCTMCNRDFPAAFSLHDHFRSSRLHPSCHRCGEGCENEAALALHRSTAHVKLQCCGEVIYEEDLEKHYITSPCHPTCKICGRGFKTIGELQIHQCNIPETPPPTASGKTSRPSDVEPRGGANVAEGALAPISFVRADQAPRVPGGPSPAGAVPTSEAHTRIPSRSHAPLYKPIRALMLPGQEANTIWGSIENRQTSTMPEWRRNRESSSLTTTATAMTLPSGTGTRSIEEAGSETSFGASSCTTPSNTSSSSNGSPVKPLLYKPPTALSTLGSSSLRSSTRVAPVTVLRPALHCRLCRADACVDITATMCGHLFCNKCITGEALKTLKCPVCAAPVVLYCLFKLDLSA
ncbi:hypothetical protein DFP72DRAFT_1110200 [Ephemerocybe angulata]|uniref:RING-type domain-containing protein n=1 Tax=Ephemerocybe angulata TaxID=980116 RepID=A0A8H6M6I3_9AGAR|nr:hypothetical protein DFP72DRAFT_1110200 [Tulosesus angulatus]